MALDLGIRRMKRLLSPARCESYRKLVLRIVFNGLAVWAISCVLLIWLFWLSVNFSPSDPSKTLNLSRETLFVSVISLSLIVSFGLTAMGGYLANVSIQLLVAARTNSSKNGCAEQIHDVERTAKLRSIAGLVSAIILVSFAITSLVFIWWAVGIYLGEPGPVSY